MGSCMSKEFFTSAHKEYSVASKPSQPESSPAAPRGSQQGPPAAAEKAISKENQMDFCWDPLQKCFKTSHGILSNSKSGSSTYNVTALATSSLVGLVQTIKDHITKPTAMARGRVAHLIEWKGWSAPQSGWEPSLPDEDQYSYLTDELKEARFAAGVAEQFAITEATLSAWSSLDDDEINYGGSSQDVIQLPDLEGIYLQEKMLPSPQAISSPQLEGILPAFCPSTCTSPPPRGHPTADEWNSSLPSLGALPCGSPHARSSQLGSMEKEPASSAREQESASSTLQQHLTSSLRYVDSSSLSEDEVFYN
ncbi:protein FAM131C [Alligator sinensis]|uniref:Protein FAM131C n=1 Tax=Alligator sinensis TaxID=38654 RepID=A0A1U7RNP8_ALLSI|nr:protein FAM131C [Alligator sinensis]